MTELKMIKLFHPRQDEAFIDEYFNGSRWIGLNDIDEEGTFVWANGDPVDFEVRQSSTILRLRSSGEMVITLTSRKDNYLPSYGYVRLGK